MRYSEILDQVYTELKNKAQRLSPKEIKEIRRSFKMTQMNFADLLGVSYGTYKNWEIGHRIPASPAMALLYVAKEYPDIFLQNAKHYISSRISAS